MSDCQCSDGKDVERRTLVLLLSINAAMFVVEFVVGWLAQSMGLIADSLDMFADAGIYTVALAAVGSSVRRKTHAAVASGILQLALAAGAAVEVFRRAITGSEPVSILMIAVSALALCANAACVSLLRKHRDGEIHMRASWIFSTTDVQANIAVMGAGILVMFTESAWPDLMIGVIVCAIVARGGLRILREARASYLTGASA
jgi:cation diffusion facilitator family transporter